jgi:hypothetical protein
LTCFANFEFLYVDCDCNPIEQHKCMALLAGLFSQLMEWTLSVIPAGAGPVDPNPVANF